MGATRAALLIWFVAVAFRLLMLWGAGDLEIYFDQSEYLALAHSLRFHGVFSYGGPHPWGGMGSLEATGPFLPTAGRPPLYPMLIAALWWGSAPPLMAIRIVQIVLGAFVAVLVYVLARKHFGPRAATIAGLAMALGPLSSYEAADILSDTLFCFLLCLGLWLWDRQQGWQAGIVLGAAVLCRDILLPAILLLGLIAIVLRFNRNLHVRIVLAALLVVAPWTVRNAVTQHAFIPVATTGWGANMLFGTIDVPYGSGNPYMAYQRDPAFRDTTRDAPTEASADRQMLVEALRRIAAAPGRWFLMRVEQYPRLFFEGPAYLYAMLPMVPALLIRGVYLLATAAFTALAAAGLFMAAGRWREVYHLAFFLVAFAVVYGFGAGAERYSLTMVPMMAMFAGYALTWRGRRAAHN